MFKKKYIVLSVLALFLSSLSVQTASAHVTTQLKGAQAIAGGGAVVWLRVPHAKTNLSSIKIEVKLPENIGIAKPEHIPGWVESSTLSSDGLNTLTVSWSGGNLPDSSFEDFGIKLTLPKEVGSKVYFPTVQTLSDGSTESWIDIPTAANPSPAQPAPSLLLKDASANVDAPAVAQLLAAFQQQVIDLYYAGTISENKSKVTVEGDAPSRFKNKAYSIKTVGTNPVQLKTGKLNYAGDFSTSISIMGGSEANAYHLSAGDKIEIFAGNTSLAKITIA